MNSRHDPPTGCIVWDKPPHSRPALLTALKEALTGKVDKAFVFGSVARGDHTGSSDLDLILVASTAKRFLDRASDFEYLYRIYPRIDLLVYTPQEFEQLSTDPSPGFWRSTVQEMERIV